MMKLPRLLSLCALALAALLPFSRGAESHVKASLVSADSWISPGQPFTVALRFEHEAHWHTYWSNPGTGLSTSLKWHLPPGWTAGDIQWPAPHLLKDKSGGIIGNGYEGELFLPVTITPPADLKPGTDVELAADADWLMCEEICVPGKATVKLTLPVSTTAPAPDPQWYKKIRAVIKGLPRVDAAWNLAATRDATNVTLSVSPAFAEHRDHLPKDLYFFSDDNLTAYDQPQTATDDGKGHYTVTVPLAADAPKDATKLLGVLTSETGWLADGSLRGLRVDVPLTASTTTTATPIPHNPSPMNAPPPASGLGGTLLLALVGGLILNLMPCVFPVLGIKILGFVNQAGHERGKVIAHGLMFALGVLLSFWALATVLAILRAGGSQLGWGFQLQSPAFVFVLAAAMLVFGMNMSGVFEIGLRATSVGGELQTKSGLSGSFFTGVLATVVATPCSAPFLAPALGAALSLSTVESFAIFTAIAIGLSLPYLLLSIFPAAVKLLPRPGAWMETFKQFMAFPLYATVGYLIWVLAGQTGDEVFQNVLFGLVLIAMGVWVYGRWRAPGASAGRARFGVIGLLVLLSAGLWLGWPQNVAAHNAAAQAAGAPEIVWEKWSPETVAKLRAENRTIYVDFTARWCATCQANKKLVFHNDEVLRYFHDKNIATLRGDWTNQDPMITAELAKYQRSAVPFNVIWKPGQDAPTLLPELLTPGTVLDALKKP